MADITESLKKEMDDRTPIQKLRRTHIQQILRGRGIPFDPTAPKGELMKLIDADEAMRKYQSVQSQPSTKSVKDAKADLENMSYFELKAYAKDLGLAQERTDKKTDLIKKITDHLNG